MKNYLITAGIALGIVVVWSSLFAPVQKVINNTTSLGAVASPDIQSPYFSFGGVRQWGAHSGLNQASTTICSLQSPAATSTLSMSSGISITTGTTTAIALEIGKSTVMDATTTRISYVTLASGAQVTLNSFVASTTAAYGSLGQRHTADETDLIFAPNTRLNVKYGGTLGSLNTLVGGCNATWLEYQP